MKNPYFFKILRILGLKCTNYLNQRMYKATSFASVKEEGILIALISFLHKIKICHSYRNPGELNKGFPGYFFKSLKWFKFIFFYPKFPSGSV